MVQSYKIRSNGLEGVNRDTAIKLGQMVLKGVKWVYHDTIRSNGFEGGQLGAQCKIQVI